MKDFRTAIILFISLFLFLTNSVNLMKIINEKYIIEYFITGLVCFFIGTGYFYLFEYSLYKEYLILPMVIFIGMSLISYAISCKLISVISISGEILLLLFQILQRDIPEKSPVNNQGNKLHEEIFHLHKQGLKQSEIACKLGKSQGYISKILNK